MSDQSNEGMSQDTDNPTTSNAVLIDALKQAKLNIEAVLDNMEGGQPILENLSASRLKTLDETGDNACVNNGCNPLCGTGGGGGGGSSCG